MGSGPPLLFGLLPKDIRPSALVIGSLGTFTGYALAASPTRCTSPLAPGGLLLGEMATSKGAITWVSPIFFGWLWHEADTVVGAAIRADRYRREHRRRNGTWGLKRAGKYLGISLVVFAIPNLPYFIGAPHQWLNGVLAPFINHTVPPAGTHRVSLFLHIGGGSLTAYTVTALVIFSHWRRFMPARIHSCAGDLCPPISGPLLCGPFLWQLSDHARPIALLAAATSFRPEKQANTVELPEEEPQSKSAWRFWPAVGLCGLIVSGAAVAFTLTSAPPLNVSVKSVHTTGQLATVERIVVAYTTTRQNRCRHRSRSRAGEWSPLSGPRR